MKKLLKEIRSDLMPIRNEFKAAYERRETLKIRPYRCGENAAYLDNIIEKIDKKLKDKRSRK